MNTALATDDIDAAADQFLTNHGFGLDAEPMWGDDQVDDTDATTDVAELENAYSNHPAYADEPAPLSTEEQVQVITAVGDADERRELIGEFVADNSRFIRILTSQIVTHYRLDATTYFGDVQSLAHETLLLVLDEIRHGHLLMADVSSFHGLWKYRTRQAVRRWLDSPEMNAASRQVSLKRRFKEMRQSEQEYMLNHGSQATPEQVVDLTNARMAATRRDPKRQGVHCTIEDYQTMVAGASVELDAIREVAVADPNENDGALHASEREQMVALTIERCYAKSHVHGRVAELFFGPSLGANFDKAPTSTEISAEVGIAAPTVRRKIAEVRDVAQEVLHTYGITSA